MRVNLLQLQSFCFFKKYFFNLFDHPNDAKKLLVKCNKNNNKTSEALINKES